MLTYKAMYKTVEGGVHAKVLDFPGAITFGRDLDDARERLAAALVDMAETTLLGHEALPAPDPSATDPESDLEEPIHLLLSAASRVRVVPSVINSTPADAVTEVIVLLETASKTHVTTSTPASSLAALDQLQQSLRLSAESAKAWVDEVRTERTASARLSTDGVE